MHDRAILAYAKEAARAQDPREWHWALMDYGAHLKKTLLNPSRKSAHYAKQSKFEGSLRQVRGAIVRAIAQDASVAEVRRRFPDRFEEALTALACEGLIGRQRISGLRRQ